MKDGLNVLKLSLENQGFQVQKICFTSFSTEVNELLSKYKTKAVKIIHSVLYVENL